MFSFRTQYLNGVFALWVVIVPIFTGSVPFLFQIHPDGQQSPITSSKPIIVSPGQLLVLKCQSSQKVLNQSLLWRYKLFDAIEFEELDLSPNLSFISNEVVLNIVNQTYINKALENVPEATNMIKSTPHSVFTSTPLVSTKLKGNAVNDSIINNISQRHGQELNLSNHLPNFSGLLKEITLKFTNSTLQPRPKQTTNSLSPKSASSNGTTLNFTATFEDSGLYECSEGDSTSWVTVYIYSMFAVQNATVCVNQSAPQKSSYSFTCPTLEIVESESYLNMRNACSTTWEMACGCQLGSEEAAYQAVISWSGGELRHNPQLYVLREEVDKANYIKLSYLRLADPSNIKQSILGKYECGCNMAPGVTIRANVYFLSPPLFIDSAPRTIRTSRDTSSHFLCDYIAYPNVNSVSWLKDNISIPHYHMRSWSRPFPPSVIGNAPFETDDPVRFSAAFDSVTQYAGLSISQLHYSDKGVYKCHLQNSIGENCREMHLRVKDPMGMYWPLIGIITEAVFMLIVILYAELRPKQLKDKNQISVDRMSLSSSLTKVSELPPSDHSTRKVYR